MFFTVVGHSEEIDAEDIFQELKEQTAGNLAGRKPKAGILFACIDTEHQALLDFINEEWPDIQLIGCTTDGELSSNKGFLQDSVVLMLLGSDQIDITAGVGRNVSKNTHNACSQAFGEAKDKTSQDAKFCITLPEGLSANSEKIVRELNSETGETIPCFGATAGDQWQFKSTYQYYCEEVLSDSVPVLLFSGLVNYSYGVASGWKPIGKPGTVTRSDGNVVHEIDNEPAIQFYKKFMGQNAKPTGECPLAILNDNQELIYLRASLENVDEQTGAISFLGDVPQDVIVQITTADRDAIIEGCKQSINLASERFPQNASPEAMVIFSCAARKLLLGTRTNEESIAIKEKYGNALPFIGFYGYGEIGPVKEKSGNTEYHNDTFVSLLIGE